MNINMLMQQAQKMQKDMEAKVKKTKEELAQTEVHAEAGGGFVKVTMTARFVVKRIQIDPEFLKDDAEMIEDLIAAAINDAVRQAETISDAKLNATTAGTGLPPGLGGMFG
jgi:DNA-binding YbaB/EbfC family protein